MKKLVSLLLTMVMLLGVGSAFADAPPHYEAAFPYGDKGGVYSKQIEEAMNKVGQKTDTSAPVWQGLPWQNGPVDKGTSTPTYIIASLKYLAKMTLDIDITKDGVPEVPEILDTDGTTVLQAFEAAVPSGLDNVTAGLTHPTGGTWPSEFSKLNAAEKAALLNYLATLPKF